MVVIAYKWGGISFDDKSLIKTLVLPTDSDSTHFYTFHDEAGDDYQVPGGKVFIVGKVMWTLADDAGYGRAGESDSADSSLTREVILLANPEFGDDWQYEDIIGIYTAGKYVTGASSLTSNDLVAKTTLHGVEIDA